MDDDDQLDQLEETPAPSKPADPTYRFGWCLTGHHRNCHRERGKLVFNCPCEDHGVDYEPLTENPMSPILQEIAARYR